MDAPLDNLLVAYMRNEIDRPTLLQRARLSEGEVLPLVACKLREARANKNSEIVEMALLLGFVIEMPENIREIVHDLLPEPWHISHENMIGLLQKSAHPSSIPYLKRAIALKPSLDYLDYDDYGSYYKKCLWALKAIGTPEAIEIIQECTQSSDQALKQQAEYRLSKIR